MTRGRSRLLCRLVRLSYDLLNNDGKYFGWKLLSLGINILGKNVLKDNLIYRLLIFANVIKIACRRLAEISEITFVISSNFISYLHIKEILFNYLNRVKI